MFPRQPTSHSEVEIEDERPRRERDATFKVFYQMPHDKHVITLQTGSAQAHRRNRLLQPVLEIPTKGAEVSSVSRQREYLHLWKNITLRKCYFTQMGTSTSFPANRSVR